MIWFFFCLYLGNYKILYFDVLTIIKLLKKINREKWICGQINKLKLMESRTNRISVLVFLQAIQNFRLLKNYDFI
jgi:uncharacterized protein YlbG (UPF0298 family)